MNEPHYQDRIERNYQVAVCENTIAELWRDLSSYLPRFG